MNYKEKIKKWLIEWFCGQTGYTPKEIEEHANDNYFDIGYIDSFGFIELIETLEETHHVAFPSDAFQDRSFATINGLAEICADQQRQGE